MTDTSNNSVRLVNLERAKRTPAGAAAWVRTHRTQAIAGAVGAVALLALYMRHRAASSNSLPADTVGVAPDTTATDLENWVQDALSGENNYLAAQLAASQTPPAPKPATPVQTGSSGVRLAANGEFVVPGAFNQTVSLRLIAADLLPPSLRNSPNAVQAELLRLVAANPGLKGKTTFLGGHLLRLPAGWRPAGTISGTPGMAPGIQPTPGGTV